METIKITPYSVIGLCGPEGCGKKYFAEKRLVPPLKKYKIAHILYNEPIEVENNLKENLKFPSNIYVGIVYVSTREGLNEVFATCKEFHFNLIVMNMNNYFEIKNKEFSNLYNVDLNLETDDEYYKVSYERSTAVTKKIENPKCCIVGDVHGSWQAFQAMLTDDKGIKIDKKTQKIVITNPEKYTHHILVGDIIDKGSYKGIRKMIEFIYDNLEHFDWCVGNHEYWVHEYLQGNIECNATNTYLIGNWFSSVVLLMHDEVLKEKFFHIYNHSYHCIDTPLAIITHAPCEVKYLRKEDEHAMRAMRNMKYPKTVDYKTEEEYLEARNNFFKFILEEADQTSKYHIFGHTMIPEVFKYKNKICIDTGCVVGGKLSVALIDDLGELTFKSYDNPKPVKLELLQPYFSFDYTNYKPDLDGRDDNGTISDNEEKS